METRIIGNKNIMHFRRQYSFIHQGSSRISSTHGWLPKIKYSKKVAALPKLSVEMKFQEYTYPEDHVPLFYFRLVFLSNDAKSVGKFMLEPDPFFRLIRLARSVQAGNIRRLCSIEKVHRDQGYRDKITIRGNASPSCFCTPVKQLERYDKEFENETHPIILYSEPVRLNTWAQCGKFCNEVYLLRISYTPFQKIGIPKIHPWKIRMEKLVQKEVTKPTIMYHNFKLAKHCELTLSTEEFLNLTAQMWDCFESWWTSVSQDFIFPQNK